MARLPDEFQFSQSALQDYADCPLRFYLRYIKGMRYPAPDAEPIRDHEGAMRLGERFHQIVQQHQIGIPAQTIAATLSASDDEDPLAAWFAAYLDYAASDGLPPLRRAESALTVALPYGGAMRRLIARYDLLAIAPGERIVIVDWKTAPRRPSRRSLQERWQTIVYPYVLAGAGQSLFGGPIAPEQISLVYWFAAAPDRPEVFPYSQADYVRDGARIAAALAEIAERPDDETAFPLTHDERRCETCVYRSYTDRGTRAGQGSSEADAEDEAMLTFDFDSLDAIAF